MLRAIGYTIAWAIILLAAWIGFLIGFHVIGPAARDAVDFADWVEVSMRVGLGVVGAAIAGFWVSDFILPAPHSSIGANPMINPYQHGTSEYELREMRNDRRQRDME